MSDKEKKYETVEIELENEVILGLALMAHERDITLNQLIVEILTDFIKKNEEKEKADATQ